MAWQDEMGTLLRVLVNDTAATVYSDDSVEQTLAAAAFQVANEMAFAREYEVSVADATIDPDPTAGDTRDDAFANLVTLKAACILDRGAAILAASQAIAVKDGPSAIDLRDRLKGKLRLLEKGGWCAAYEDAKLEYLTGQAGPGTAGAAVLTPFRLVANGGWGQTSDPRDRELYP